MISRSDRIFAYSERHGHDASIAIVGEGKIFHFEGERFTGVRHQDGSMQPWREACMQNAGVSWEDIAIVGCGAAFTTDWPVGHRCHKPGNWKCETNDIDETFIGGEIIIPNMLGQPIGKTKLCHISHHMSHACYGFYTSPFDCASSMTMDGGGDACIIPETGEIVVSSGSIGSISHNFGSSSVAYSIKHFRGSYGSVGAAWTGMSINLTGRKNQDGTVMALVGSSVDHPLKQEILKLQQRTNNVFSFQASLPPLPRFVISGGCALNGIATYHLLKAGIVDQVFVPPSVNDGGLTVGDALFAFHSVIGVPRVAYSPATVAYSGWDDGVPLIPDEIADQVADLIVKGKVVGVFQGRAESGPRALGHRSILADPTDPTTKDKINQIKGRQSYRPVAPAMTKDYAMQHFELIDPEAYYFMTCICASKPSAKKQIPSALHEDGTARIQILTKEAGLDGVIDSLVRRGRPPCVLNTSFNGPGQAIVHTKESAVATAKKLGLHAVAIGDTLTLL